MIQLLKQTFEEWRSDSVGVLAAGLAFYSMLSLAPILIIVIAVLRFFGRADAQGVILDRIRSVTGPEAAQLTHTMIENRQAATGDLLATAVGLGLVVVGATGVLAQLQNAFHIIWDVKVDPDRSGLGNMLRVRARSLLLILGVGLLLLGALVGSRILQAVIVAAQEQVPQVYWLWTVLDPLILIVVSGFVFALVFKYLPNVRISWRTVAVGGLVTAVGFVIANWTMSEYLTRAAVASAYGAAGALVVILLWVFVSAQIVLLGAEFTQVYARRRGEGIVPDERAVARDR